MLAHAQRERPNESCGLIAFQYDRAVKLYPGTNVLASATRYRMEDREVLGAVDEIDRKGWWLGAIYHSHPTSPAVPSSTDLREANWPDALMIIISLQHEQPDVRAYRTTHQSFTEVPIVVTPPRPSMLLTLAGRARQLWANLMPAQGSTPTSMPTPAIAVGGAGRGIVEPASADTTLEWEPERRATIGILGGMGPLATVDLYGKIVSQTPAGRDQEHIPVIVYADPRVPDRSAALLHGGEDPIPWLIHGARQLAALDPDFIVIPCNTAHAFLHQVQPHVDRPILSMIDAAADAIATSYPDVRVVGLLATSGTISTEIYQRALAQRGIDTLTPGAETQQRCVMAAIHNVKAGDTGRATVNLLVEAANELTQRGAGALLAACTEIPVVLQQRSVRLPLIDATDTLARLAITTAQQLDQSRNAQPYRKRA
jgi:aspartate racemase